MARLLFLVRIAPQSAAPLAAHLIPDPQKTRGRPHPPPKHAQGSLFPQTTTREALHRQRCGFVRAIGNAKSRGDRSGGAWLQHPHELKAHTSGV